MSNINSMEVIMKNNQQNNFPVRVRGGFSDRNGIKKENTQMQFKSFDDRTRVSLINCISQIYDILYSRGSSYDEQIFLKCVLRDVYLFVIDETKNYVPGKVFDIINKTITDDDYDAVLTLLEYLIKAFDKKSNEVYKVINNLFESEYVGYRFINEYITPITNDIEIAEIEEATDSSNLRVNEHLDKALLYISNREKPDYENSIKESISAVEALCSDKLGQGVSLGQALEKLCKQGLNIHPNMKEAFHLLFKYTSDASGIRHAGQIGGVASTFEEAKFMLVTCSAFINYLNVNMEKYN